MFAPRLAGHPVDSLYKIGGIRASGVGFDPTDIDLLSDDVVMAAS